MKKGLTHIVAILDKSGSMKVVQDDTIGGFNTFLDEQKKVPGEAILTLVQFSDKCETLYTDVPLNHVAPLTRETYIPSGWTALNDSLARTMNEVGVKLASKREEERPEKVVVLIMTDGAENSSKEFGGFGGRVKVGEMVKHQKEKYSWEFCFIGANIDSFTTAGHYGIDIGSTINYVNNSTGSQNAFKSASRGMAATRTAQQYGGKVNSFFENERNMEQITDSVLDTSDIGETIGKYTATGTFTTAIAGITTSITNPTSQLFTTSDVDPNTGKTDKDYTLKTTSNTAIAGTSSPNHTNTASK